jgi:hypothetical protein
MTTLAEMRIGNPSGNLAASGTVRYYSDRDFTAPDGVKYKGGRLDSRNFFLSNTWSVSGGDLIVPALPDFPPTTDGTPGTAKIQAGLYSGTTRIGMLFDGYQIPASPSGPLTMRYLESLKHLPTPVRSPETLSKTDFAIMLEEALSATDTAGVGVLGRIETATAPVDPVHPKAVLDEDPRLDNVGSLSDDSGSPLLTGAVQLIGSGGTTVTRLGQQLVIAGGGGAGTDAEANIDSGSNLGTTITAIGSAQATVVINHPITQSLALTIPSNISLVFSGNGTLTLVNNNVVIQGPMSVMGGPRKIFIYSGSGVVDFSGNRSIPQFSEKWFGVVGDGIVDDTAAWQKCSDAMEHGFTLKLTDNSTYKITSTVIFDHLMKFNMIGNGSGSLGLGGTGNMPMFVWAGSDGGGPVLTLNNVYECTFQGFGVFGFASMGTVGAAIGIYVTMTAGGSPGLTSACVFDSLLLQANSNRADWISLKFDNASGANNEQHNISHCFLAGGQIVNTLNATGTGIYLGHVNIKHIILSRNTYYYLAKAVDSQGGSFRAEYNVGTGNKIRYSGSVSDAITIIGEEGESDNQEITLTGSGAVGTPVFMAGCRFDDLRGGQAASATTSVSPVISVSSINLVVENNSFGAQSNFTKDFIKDNVGGSSVAWIGNGVYDFSNKNRPTPQYLIDAGLNSFSRGSVVDGFDTRWVGIRAALSSVMTRPTSRFLIQNLATQPNELTNWIPAATNSIVLGMGELEITGLARPNKLTVTVIGTPGATPDYLQVLARDGLGNRTLPSTVNDATSTANATLSGSNYLQIDWPAVPGATDYLILQYSGGTWRSIATVTASGTDYETYNLVANPGGVFTYVPPTFNETATNIFRGRITTVNEIALIASDTTPSVAQGNDFVTANSGATSISTFDDGLAGQEIRIRINDANTTLLHGSGLLNRTGANITATNGLIYTYIKRGSSWYQLG